MSLTNCKDGNQQKTSLKPVSKCVPLSISFKQNSVYNVRNAL